MTTPFDYSALRDALGLYATRFDAEHLPVCDSTNTLLLQRALAGAPAGSVIICDLQTAGRGRRGRQWISTPGDSLSFSLLWHFDDARMLAGLSLAVGVAVARTLEALGVAHAALKWPNDIWLGRRKLGGVLVETVPLGAPPTQRAAVVIGIGLNLRWNAALAAIDTPAAALAQSIALPPREALLALLLRELAKVLDVFERDGFAALRGEWLSWHGLQGQAVRVIEDTRSLRGTCEGVDDQGALLLQTEAGRVHVRVGDVSLREDTCTS